MSTKIFNQEETLYPTMAQMIDADIEDGGAGMGFEVLVEEETSGVWGI
jgi:hypothetical protein